MELILIPTDALVELENEEITKWVSELECGNYGVAGAVRSGNSLSSKSIRRDEASQLFFKKCKNNSQG